MLPNPGDFEVFSEEERQIAKYCVRYLRTLARIYDPDSVDDPKVKEYYRELRQLFTDTADAIEEERLTDQ